MYDLEPITLSGRTINNRHPWTVNAKVGGRSVAPESNVPPRTGDLRLTVMVDVEARILGGKRGGLTGASAELRRGVLTASVFDGLVWRRFDLACISGVNAFTSLEELEALQDSVRAAAESVAGKVCVAQPEEGSTFLQYTIEKPAAKAKARSHA